MKDQEQRPKSRSAYQRQAINDNLPYELLAFATIRYYANLQALGLFDIVEHVIFVEKVSEQEAIAKCLGILKQVGEDKNKLLANYIYLTNNEKTNSLSDPNRKN